MSVISKSVAVYTKATTHCSTDMFTRIVILSPRFLLALLILPVIGGLISELLPAFGYAPVLE
ncbi:ABC transporter permease, partial [Pseudoalteromonas undina]